MKTLVLKIIPILFVMLWTGMIHAQTITTTAGSVTSCPGGIVVSIDVTNCNNVGAISLMLEYNDAVLTYTGYQNLHTDLSSTGLLVINSTGSKVTLAWASTTAANVGNNTLVEYLFSSVPGTSPLNWDTQISGNCEYSDINANILPDAYVNGTATIDQPPVVTAQPTDKTALVGQNTSFSLSAIGTGLAYRWQGSSNGGSSWSDLNNSSTYSGVTNHTLNIYDVQLPMDGFMYRCKLTGTCTPPDVYSNEVTLTVIDPITTILPTANHCPGSVVAPVEVTNFTSVAAFSLSFAYDPAVLTYTNYQSLNPTLSGGTFVINATGGMVYMTWYSTTAVTFGDGTLVELLFTAVTGSSGLVWDQTTSGNCEYTDGNGNLITSVFVNGNLTIYGIPTVVTQPVDRTIAKGQNTTFGITASGTGLSYLWQLSTNGGSSWNDLSNGGHYSNVTNPTMNITNAQLSMSGYLYRCRVTGTCSPVVYSDPGLLTVLPNVVTTCQTLSACPGQIVVQVNVADFIAIGAFSMTLDFNPAILTYTGYQNLNATLSGGNFAANAAGGKVYVTWARTTVATLPTDALLIELIFSGLTGSSTLIWDTQTLGNCEYNDVNGQVIFSTWIDGNVTVYQPPLITVHPSNANIYSGGSTLFSVTATGTGLSYRWQESTNGGINWSNLTNVPPYSGVYTASLTINPAVLSMTGFQYRCYITGTCTPYLYSNSAQLTVTDAAITTSASGVTNSCTGNLVIPILVSNCTNVGGISLTLNYDTAKLTYDGYQSLHSELSSGLIVVHSTETQLIFGWTSVNPADIGSGTLVEYRFKANSGISTSLTWDTQTPGNCEYSFSDGMVSTSFYHNATITVVAYALSVDAGNDTTISPGGTAQLNGSASGGTPPYTYLWTPSTGLSNPNIPNPTASPPSTTTYTLTVNDVSSCYGSDDVEVVVSVPENLVLQDITVSNGEDICYDATQTITVAGGGTFFTVESGGSATMIAGQSIHYLPGTHIQNGGYLHGYITTTGQYCESLPPDNLIPEEPEEFLPAHSEDHSFFKIYPNPTTGNFIIELNDENSMDKLYVTAYGMHGNIIFREEFTGGKKHEFSLSDKSSGMYFIRVITADQNNTKILIKY